jgi:hypothetical protein
MQKMEQVYTTALLGYEYATGREWLGCAVVIAGNADVAAVHGTLYANRCGACVVRSLVLPIPGLFSLASEGPKDPIWDDIIER